MLIRRFVFGPIETNCYLVACEKTGQALVIDPDIRKNDEKERFCAEVEKRQLKLGYVVNTHHHSDHTGGNRFLKKKFGSEILIHELDAAVLSEPWSWWRRAMGADPTHPCPACGGAGHYLKVFKEEGKAVMGHDACGFKFEIMASPPADRQLRDGDRISIGKIDLSVIHTPGHSPGGICLYAEEENVVFTGDTLFYLSVGRTDMVDGSFDEILKSVKKLMSLPEKTVAYPGHGEKTTIGQEKRRNPFLQDTND